MNRSVGSEPTHVGSISTANCARRSSVGSNRPEQTISARRSPHRANSA